MRFLKSFHYIILVSVALLLRFSVAAQYDAIDSVKATSESDSFFHFDTIATANVIVGKEPVIADSTLQQLRKDDAFWYANAEFKKQAPKNKTHERSFFENLIRQQWFRTLVWFVIIGSFITVLLLFLWKSNVQLFHKAPVSISSANEAAALSIFSIDYGAEIKKAVQENDYRSAVRFYYLQTLALLSGKGLINYKEDSTNSDYLLQLHQTTHYNLFKKLTRHFEYTWYGKFDVSGETFKNMETDFHLFKNGIAV